MNHNIYTWMKRGIMRVKCLAEEHNAVVPPLGLSPDQPNRSPGPGCIKILKITENFLGFPVLFYTFAPNSPIKAQEKISQSTGNG